MTRLYDDPSNFKEDVIAGFAVAYGRYVDRVEGASGFVRRGGARAGKVSLVVGGGSGHYPSYAGIVGAGFADGCVLGDVFTSPSAEQVYRIAKAADGGAGVVLAFGNYAGDRLNFGVARERLIAEGIDTRIVFVTDDVASADPSESEKRRGIAGTFTVYKVGGAAADAGADLDTVERLMQAANDATFSFGAAFAGCTFPGSTEPLFTVDPGEMELGMGIHGEPGIEAVPWMHASALADTLVDHVLAERPAEAGPRAAVIVNGLGATKYEELFLLYGSIDRRLVAAGIEPVLPEVGELVTSLDMAGCSLSITWLDDELESYWTAPADTAAFRRGDVSGAPTFAARVDVRADEASPNDRPAGSEDSIAAAGVARRMLDAIGSAIAENEDLLGRLDAVAGDGDHGVGMLRGITAAIATERNETDGVGKVLRSAGTEFADRAGGTSGILWGSFLGAIGDALGDTDQVTAQGLSAALAEGADTIQKVGGAKPGDKTMLDALIPFVNVFSTRVANGEGCAAAWIGAAEIAGTAATETAGLVPRVGRARPLADRSVGTPDPGAISMAICLTAAGQVLAELANQGEDQT